MMYAARMSHNETENLQSIKRKFGFSGYRWILLKCNWLQENQLIQKFNYVVLARRTPFYRKYLYE